MAFVVDVVDTVAGWHPICLEIRGRAALRDVEPPADGFSRELIRIHPDWVRSSPELPAARCPAHPVHTRRRPLGDPRHARLIQIASTVPPRLRRKGRAGDAERT
jgi:hypothetical protein